MENIQNNPSVTLRSPSNFRVIAIISTFNEEDVIVPVIQHLVNQGIDVYLVDNWSTDRTYELVQNIEAGIVGVERWPAQGPSGTYDWGDILKEKKNSVRNWMLIGLCIMMRMKFVNLPGKASD